LGPESAGSRVGTCYQYPDITIGDLDLILGYLNPDYFLGGKVKLNKEAAIEQVRVQLADPLAEDVYGVSSKVLDLLHSRLRGHLMSMLLAKGLNPADYDLMAYGGSGPLHLWGIVQGLNLKGVYTCPWAAAFSAYGVAAADYFHRYERSVMAVLAPALPSEAKLMQASQLNEAWQELEQHAHQEMAREGFPKDKVSFRYGIYARYSMQMTSWISPVDVNRVNTIEDINRIIASFEKTYSTIYPAAARMPESGYTITGVYLESVGARTKPVATTYRLREGRPSQYAFKGRRNVYHGGKWQNFDIWEMDLLDAGNRIDGPAIVEHPMTTLVIPPENYVVLDEHKLISYRMK
jgi:acetone carboxylase beta subunit